MKRLLMALGLIAALGASRATAQTRVSVSIGFGAPAPFVYYARPYRPYYYHRSYYEVYPPLVVVRPRVYRVPIITRPRPVLVLRNYPRRYHHHRHW